MQQRRGTATQWTTANPVLAAGEIGFETDTNKFKIGDGTNTWSNLDYFTTIDNALIDIVAGAPEALDTLNELAAALADDPNFATSIATEFALRVKIIKKTDAEWTAQNITLDAAEVGFNTTNNRFKIGTGAAVWSDLPYIVDEDVMASAIESAVDALESSINTTLEDYAPLNGPTFAGTVVLPTTTSVGDVSSDELGYLNGVTSGIQGQLDAKADAATVASTYAPINDPVFTGNVELPATTTIGNVSSTELGYIATVTSDVQDQLDDKAPIESPTFTGTVSGITASMVGLGNVDNTSDADKPVSTATQTALDAKADLSGATFTGAVTIEGNLSVTGTTTTINATDLAVSDPLIYLASGQYDEDILDVGFLAATGEVGGTEQSHLHSGLFRDVSDGKKWKLVTNVPHPVDNTVDVTNAEYETLVVGNLEATGVVFSDGTQTKQGVPSITAISQKTDSYTLENLNERDTIIEISKSTGTTLTIPTDATLNFPVGTTLDIIQTGSGQVTIAGAGGVTVNATPGLKLRAQWSSATLLKRAANTWLVYGDLTA